MKIVKDIPEIKVIAHKKKGSIHIKPYRLIIGGRQVDYFEMEIVNKPDEIVHAIVKLPINKIEEIEEE